MKQESRKNRQTVHFSAFFKVSKSKHGYLQSTLIINSEHPSWGTHLDL